MLLLQLQCGYRVEVKLWSNEELVAMAPLRKPCPNRAIAYVIACYSSGFLRVLCFLIG